MGASLLVDDFEDDLVLDWLERACAMNFSRRVLGLALEDFELLGLSRLIFAEAADLRVEPLVSSLRLAF